MTHATKATIAIVGLFGLLGTLTLGTIALALLQSKGPTVRFATTLDPRQRRPDPGRTSPSRVHPHQRLHRGGRRQ